MLVLAALLLPAAQAAPLPGIGPNDDRVAVDPAQPPWRALGRVQTELGARCTGFLVGPRLVLTAAHCLYRAGPGHFVQPRSVHFLLGYASGSWAAHARAVAFRIGNGYDPAQPQASPGSDWAWLVLDAPLGTPDRILPLETSVPPLGTPVLLGGYEQDRAEVLDADLHCSVEQVGRDRQGRLLIVHGCNGTRGSSGAPLLVRRGSGWAAIGVAIRAAQGAARGLAVAAAAIAAPG